MQNIGHRIADMRETKGITQAALAKKLKTTQSAVARIEAGKQNVSADMLKRIGQALEKTSSLYPLAQLTFRLKATKSFQVLSKPTHPRTVPLVFFVPVSSIAALPHCITCPALKKYIGSLRSSKVLVSAWNGVVALSRLRHQRSFL